MRKEPEFIYEQGKAICMLTDKNNKPIIGIADCHPDDADMENEKTGYEIAFKRAKIASYRRYRDELKERLAALNQLFYSMKMSKHFNPNSYENRMLQRQIRLTKMDLDTAKEMIATEQQKLREYINAKDEFYKKIRSNRERKIKSSE